MSTSQLPGAFESRDNPPFEWYRRMQEESPVHYDAQREVWDIFRYEDVTQVLRDHTAFSSNFLAPDIPRPITDDDPTLFKSMLRVDGDVHDRRRDFAADRFAPGTISILRPRIEEIADALLTRLAGKDRTELIGEFASQLPLTVIADLLGIPPDDRELFKAVDPADFIQIGDLDQEHHQIHQKMDKYFSELLAERAGGDGDDLITLAATAGALSQEEKIAFCISIFIAGSITTTTLIGGAIWHFVNQNLTDELRSGSIDREKAIEEVIRYRSPVQSVTRKVIHPVELGGKQIKEGDVTTAWLGAANRDPGVFTAPDEFRPNRSPNPHIAFGGGEHFCFGAALGRLEGNVAIQTLLDRFDRIPPEGSETLPRHMLPPLVFE